MMATPELNYTCEICGADGLTDDGMRDHIKLYHLRDAISCPFCDLGDVSAQEMLTHVNNAHLDYLTPDAERLAFIDDTASDIALRPPSAADPPLWALLSPKSQRLRLNNNNNNNNNNSYYEVKPNGGAGCSDWVSSSQRSQLALNLCGATTTVAEVVGGGRGVLTCPMCLYRDDNTDRLAEHINRRHFDLTSPSFPSLNTPSTPTPDGATLFSCPLCAQTFPESRDLELHVNIEHKEILSPAKPNQLAEQPSKSSESCPVCCMTKFKDTEDLASHIDDHFNQKGVIPITPDMSCDRLLAKEMEKQDKEMQRLREQHEFEQLRAQYGMDNEGNFKEQSMTNMQRAVYSGELSVADYYERQVELRMAEHCGVDDGSSCTKDLVAAIITISSSGANVARTFMCTTVDHYASTYGDKGWGCGYRNMQMMLSSLLQHTGYNERLYRLWGISADSACPVPSRSAMPSISRLQHHIEWAWRQCFDPQGCDQLGGKLVNTRKWIGATEVVTVFSSLHIRCQLVDFHRPTCTNGSHPELFNWILEYFQANDDFKPPLYLQHQGHSRTIVGVEQLKDGTLLLLVFDPSHSPRQMAEFKSTATCLSAMRLVRKSLAAMKARQYQVVAVCGLMDTEHEFQQSKQFKSVRVPPER